MAASTQPESIHGTLARDHHLLHGQFRTHKVLPRPRDDRTVDINRAALAATPDVAVDRAASTASPSLQRSSPRVLKHQSKRIGSGPELPPTPPTHSRVSSISQPAQPPSPSSQDAGLRTPQPQASSRRPPATPPDQRSPPTPDVTPPQLGNRTHALQSLVPDHGYSCAVATTGLHIRSFRTAGEEPSSFDDEAAIYTGTKEICSSNPLQTSISRFPFSTTPRQAVHPHALDLALGCLTATPEEMYTPRNRGEPAQHDGKWRSLRKVETEWDIHLPSLVSASTRNPKSVTPTSQQHYGAKNEVPEDKPVTPKRGTKDIRNMSPKGLDSVEPSPKPSQQSTPQRNRTGPVASRSETSGTPAPKRLSGLSTHSMPSTVVEAMLVDTTRRPPKQRTLRHVRKHRELREPREPSPRGQQSAVIDGYWPPAKESPLSNSKSEHARKHDSYASATSPISAASGRARKDVWKAGGIPVVVIPDRTSSHKAKSREPSLRSSSSRHSRTRSAVSFPLNQSPPYSESDRQSRWDRSTSAFDQPDKRTMDFPPIIPVRSSSLSAPTSRNTSRTASLTVESIKALNDMHREHEKPHPLVPAPVAATAMTRTAVAATNMPANPATPSRTDPSANATVPASQIATPLGMSNQSPQTPQSDWSYGCEPFDADHRDDTALAKKYSSRATPFSVISMETNWTVPVISEAQAVHMYPHQNSSVLRIHHSVKPQDMKHAINGALKKPDSHENPEITTTSPDGGVTTPEQQKSWAEVDSPLRNPRSPPDVPIHPPAINFIPATPSGLTPAEERQVQLGNFYEIAFETPARRPSFVTRAFSRQRRHSFSYSLDPSTKPGFLARTFSLSRTDRQLVDLEKSKFLDPDMEPSYSDKQDQPAEQDKLHPHWRPQWDNGTDDCDCSSCRHGGEGGEEIYRYPLIDNRPLSLKRSLSAKVKNTFAILPARQDDPYYMDDAYGPERRTIRRTPSGNLKVMRRRSSDYSLRRQTTRLLEEQRRVSRRNAPEGFWRRYSLRRRRSTVSLRRSSSLGSRLGGMPSLTTRWNEKRREKRTRELRQTISGPREVRDGVGEIVRLSSSKNQQRDDSR
ncbi:hypothetical protein E4U42_005465 [Claviceps africana]|uniref:Uncharacterized protein n=1 Tax=Claviceps africana TaxID=83212 RepID=A0A8K0J3K9_9HYPO|nr:hypothetical protein E4U42_005465 [Claviceps africana]